MRIPLEQFVSREAPSDNFKPNQTLQTTNFMCFDALKPGVVSIRLLNETTWNKQRRRKRTHNTKKRFGKPISQCELSTKLLKPRGTYHTRENVTSANKSTFVEPHYRHRSAWSFAQFRLSRPCFCCATQRAFNVRTPNATIGVAATSYVR